MIHETRVYHDVADCTTDEVVADFRRCTTFTLCSGFRVRYRDGQTYLLLNDSFSEDGAQEFAFLRITQDLGEGRYTVLHMESLTVSWVAAKTMAAKVHECLDSTFIYGQPFTVQIEETHRRCQYCA